MESLGFYNHVSKFPRATEVSLESIRRHYPTAPIILSTDGSDNYIDYHRLANKHDCHLHINHSALGYPPYEWPTIQEWMQRLFDGFYSMDCEYVMMWEDDLLVLNKINLHPTYEFLGHRIVEGNYINPFIIEDIEKFSGTKQYQTQYGCGGGSIFKRATLISNYNRVMKFFKEKFPSWRTYYWPQVGYMDCYMHLFYMMCGKHYSTNRRMLNLDPHTMEAVEAKKLLPTELATKYQPLYDIVHNYKWAY